MITIGNVVEVCSIINEASSKLTMIIGEQVELRLITPALPGLEANNQIMVEMNREIMIHTIINIVCEQFMVSVSALKGPMRNGPVCDARKVSALLLSKYVVDMTDIKISQILKMSRVNAATTLEKAEEYLTTESAFAFQYNQALKRLKKAITNNG